MRGDAWSVQAGVAVAGNLLKRLFRVKGLQAAVEEPEEPRRLRRVLGPVQLTLLGVGAIVGAGIFAMVGTAAAGDAQRPGAGPALVLSFALTGAACLLTALCYGELAALTPVAGSAYTYAYTSLGELVAWVIGWDLVLEYAVGNVAVAVSWSGYFAELLRGLGIDLPPYLVTDLRAALADPAILAAAPRVAGVPLVVNLPAMGIVTLLTAILVAGIRQSAYVNAVMVAIKLAVLAFFVVAGLAYVRPEHWRPFAPHGWAGIQAGAAVVFFAFIGFDAVSTAAEECRHPARDLPVGILASLGICTAIYIVVTLVLTGMVPWTELNTAEPLSVAMRQVNLDWAAGLVAFGSVVAHTAVLLVFQLGQPRIFLAMSRDGLLPGWLGKTHPRFRTPHVATIVTGVLVAVASAFASLQEMADLCNIGTLSAFLLVCVSVPVLRRRDPARARPFRTPWSPALPLLGAAACLVLMAGLPRSAWARFAVWLAAGLAVYAMYGFRRSRLAAAAPAPQEPS